MRFTIIKNEDGSLAKEMKSDGTKRSNANLINGLYNEVTVNNLDEFNNHLEGLEHNEAIMLGVTEKPQGKITAQGMLESMKSNFTGEHIIARTKNNFSFQNESILLFDIDTDDGANIECKSYDNVLDILNELDPQFNNAEILIRHSSSSYIYRWNKSEREQVKGAGSYHLYIRAKNVDTDLDDYITALEDKAWELGYGYFKISNSGSMLKRQIFDSYVFSSERLVFEAGMICQEPYEQDKPEAFYKEGTFIDCKNAPSVDIEIVNTQLFNAKEKVQEQADEIREYCFYQEEQKLVDLGYPRPEAKLKVQRFLSDMYLAPEYKIILADGTEISAKDAFWEPDKYAFISCYDPIYPEKGSGKAILYTNDGVNPIIHSFVHGGINYKLEIDFRAIRTIAESLTNDPATNNGTVQRIKKLATQANLSESERKEMGTLLKSKKITHSINDLVLTADDIREIGEGKGYVNFTPKGTVAPTVDNLRVLMENEDMGYEYDVILKNPDIRHPDIVYNGPNKEAANISLIEKFAYTEGINPQIVNHITALANSDYCNPLMDYAKESHIKYMDNPEYKDHDYIGEMAKTITANETTPFYKREILEKWFIQCIAVWDYERTTPRQDAKEKFESVLVLQGKQGIQKTKFFSALLPKDKEHYIKTGAMLNPSDKDSLMQNTSYGIVELGELESTFNKSDIGALKAFLSNSWDEYRVPYGKTASRNKRCTSFCGSVNESGFLRDPTGARRFWVLPVQRIDFKAFESIDKDLLWGQAYDLYMNGEKWWFDETDTKVNKELQKLHNIHKAYSIADEVFNEIKEYNTAEMYMNVSAMFEKYSTKSPTRSDLSELSTLLDNVGFKRNSRKQFLVPTNYKYQSTLSSKPSVIDFISSNNSNDSTKESIDDMIENIEASI
ncbi:MAG: hypothetical protein J7L43_02405 [Candidatus Aenigmarchaeota archaeon]|nr:hypothetical protein [Candidatus Aenigmarchaeota archaeon]